MRRELEMLQAPGVEGVVSQQVVVFFQIRAAADRLNCRPFALILSAEALFKSGT